MSGLQAGSAAGISYLRRREGALAPFVLAHGIGSNAESFTPLMQAIDARHPVLAWNAPGYGASQPLATDCPDVSDYAEALRHLLDACDLGRVVLVGHSLGVLVAARFALTWPQRVGALALISPALGYATPADQPLPASVAARIVDLDKLGPAGFAAARAPGLMGASPRPEVLHAVEAAMSAVKRPGYDQAVRMLAGGRLLEDVARLDVPTAVLVGTADRVTPPANARRVFEALPQPRERNSYHEIAGAGHAVCQEEPDIVARLLVTFAAAARA